MHSATYVSCRPQAFLRHATQNVRLSVSTDVATVIKSTLTCHMYQETALVVERSTSYIAAAALGRSTRPVCVNSYNSSSQETPISIICECSKVDTDGMMTAGALAREVLCQCRSSRGLAATRCLYDAAFQRVDTQSICMEHLILHSNAPPAETGCLSRAAWPSGTTSRLLI